MLYSQGFTEEELVDFELTLTNPSSIAEQEKLELWSSKLDLASTIKDGQMVSEDWIYKNVFNMNDEEVAEERAGVVKDIKQKFRKSQIEMEGNDPQDTGEALGTPHTLATIDPENTEGNDSSIFGDTPNEPGQGRPEEGNNYGTQDSARGRDTIGKEERKRDTKLSNNKSQRRFESRKISKLFTKKKQYKSDLLNESNILKDDI